MLLVKIKHGSDVMMQYKIRYRNRKGVEIQNEAKILTCVRKRLHFLLFDFASSLFSRLTPNPTLESWTRPFPLNPSHSDFSVLMHLV